MPLPRIRKCNKLFDLSAKFSFYVFLILFYTQTC